MSKTLLSISLALVLAACGSGATAEATGTGAVASAAATTPSGPPQLHLRVSGETGVRSRIEEGGVVREPSCMTALVVENLSDQPLWNFRADFTPTHAQTGAALEVVMSLRAGVPRLSSQNPLNPGTRGEPWKMNVVGAACDQVQYTLGPIDCLLFGGSCDAASVEHVDVAGVSPLRFAPPRR